MMININGGYIIGGKLSKFRIWLSTIVQILQFLFFSVDRVREFGVERWGKSSAQRGLGYHPVDWYEKKTMCSTNLSKNDATKSGPNMVSFFVFLLQISFSLQDDSETSGVR